MLNVEAVFRGNYIQLKIHLTSATSLKRFSPDSVYFNVLRQKRKTSWFSIFKTMPPMALVPVKYSIKYEYDLHFCVGSVFAAES